MKFSRKSIANWGNYLKHTNIRKALKGDFFKGAATLGSVTVLSQIISFSASIILTRIYSPKDFGIQAIFASILSQIAVLASFRYEWAILLPKRKNTAFNLLFLCFISSIGVSGITLAIILLWGSYFAQLDNIKEVEPFILMLPLAILMTGVYQALNYWFLREKNFNEIAKTNISQSLSTSSTQIILGSAIPGPFGLLIGTTLNPSVGAIRFLSITLSSCVQALKETSIQEITKTGKTYYRFPTFSLCSSFINSAGLLAPIFMVSHFYTISDVGSFALARRLMAIPIGVIGKSVFQVFLSNATSLISENPKRLRKQYLDITVILLFIALLISFFLWFSPLLFPVFFGDRWHESGIIVRCMIPFFISSFAVSSLSILDWLNKQNWMFVWNSTRLLAVFSGFYIAGIYQIPLSYSIFIFSCITTFLYIGLFTLNLLAINNIIATK